MNKDLRFTKIKYDGAKVRLEYQIPRKGADPDEFSLQLSEQPRPEFDLALQALVTDVIDICELLPADITKLKVRGVTISHTNDIRGAVVTALKRVQTANAPVVLNTPHLPSEAYSGEQDGSPVMPTAMRKRIDAMEQEALRYLNGERAQGNLLSASDNDAPRDDRSGSVLDFPGAPGEFGPERGDGRARNP